VEYDDDPAAVVAVGFAARRKPDPPAGFSDRLSRFYGVARTENSAVVSVP
jgi:hypothetical protein